MPPAQRAVVSLRRGLDQDVYAIILKYVDRVTQENSSPQPQLSVPLIYQYIHKSNSSLARKSKPLVEGSIARVLGVFKQDAQSGNEMSSVDGDFDDPDAGNLLPVNNVNNSIVGTWKNKSKGQGVSSTVPAEVGILQPAPEPLKNRKGNGEPLPKRRKAATETDRNPPTHVSVQDLGGLDNVFMDLKRHSSALLCHDIYIERKTQPTRGILLHGPPGCGKTMVANAFAAALGVPFLAISGPSIVSGMSGESEKGLRDLFDEAKKVAPSLVFIDEIDAVTPKRETSQREMEKRIVAQLLTCMDDLDLKKTGGKAVMVLAATNRPDSLDPALRRGGRFDKEINIGVPDENTRELILKTLTQDMALPKDLSLRDLAKRTPGFVGADLKDLVSTADSAAINRYMDTFEEDGPGEFPQKYLNSIQRLKDKQLEGLTEVDRARLSITMEDFSSALSTVQPSAKREGFTTIPETTWTHVGALKPVRKQLQVAVVEAIKNPERYARVGITAPVGVLLWGPPGCGKTLLAMAVANESKANFISVKGPELLNKYVGESEKAVRQLFNRASSSAPCIIFFDELDALVPSRNDSLSESSARVVNTLLTELDGVSKRRGIYVIAATNRPDMIDPAMLRPGRLDTRLFVDLPDADERVEILQTLCHNSGTSYTDEIGDIARSCEGFSGADLGSLRQKAGYAAIERNDTIRPVDFRTAKAEVKPSVGDRRRYDRLKDW
ncbi:Ribosome biogenesis ATPase rix7 [Lecanora helva]